MDHQGDLTEQERALLNEQVDAWEEQERRRLGSKTTGWAEPKVREFLATEREGTTILFGGFTLAHDELVAYAMRGLGYTLTPLKCPDNGALNTGKEYGNRGQCNPTYFTVGNLVQHLQGLQEGGLSTKEIITNYVFVTVGACGPCRFGMYATEYRKALRDAGFEGFRVLLFQQQGELEQATGDERGLDVNARFGWAFAKALMIGDILNLLTYRIRPYEVVEGDTDRAITRCRALIGAALEHNRSVTAAMLRCRRILRRVEVDRSIAKPKVSIIGEFWAMTTEGAGNYELQRFLESEGAEVDIQPIINWLLYLVWDLKYDTLQRIELREHDTGLFGLEGTRPARKLVGLRAMDLGLRGVFQLWANVAGLHRYTLPDLEEIAALAEGFYDLGVKGGEGHMEVGKLVHFLNDRVNHLTISVKPFGCMPSSGVSDGIQSAVTAKFPDAAFLAIETNGDGAVNVYSRVQMMLHKARGRAKQELAESLQAVGVDQESFAERLRQSRHARALAVPHHHVAGTAANLVRALYGGR